MVDPTLLAFGKPIRWKWKHIYITSRPVYRAESRLETPNLLSRLHLNGPSFALPTPPFLIPVSILEDSKLKLVYVTPLESAPWTGSPPLTFIYGCTGFSRQVSLTLGCCDDAACAGRSDEAGSESGLHFAFVRIHDVGEDPALLAVNLRDAGDSHDCDDHIARWSKHNQTFYFCLPAIGPIPLDLRRQLDPILLLFRDCMPHMPLTTLKLMPVVLGHSRRS